MVTSISTLASTASLPDFLNPLGVERYAILPSRLFFDFYRKLKGTHPRPDPVLLPPYILGLDPGETTGVSLWIRIPGTALYDIYAFQVNTSIIQWGVDKFKVLIRSDPGGSIVVVEDYRIYAWKAKDHSWQTLLTPRLVGVAETFCHLSGIPIVKQMAQQGKSFAKDDKLESWELYVRGLPHAMDAMRHVCQLLLFSEWK